MATNIVQFTAGDYGGAGADPALIVGIGGTAAAGDCLEVTTCGIDGDGDQAVVVSDDVSGSTGWTLLGEYTHPSEHWRTQAWTKIAVGGETTITATWPGSSNRTLVGFWAQTPTQPAVYLIDSGPMVWTGVHMSFFAGAGTIQTDNETYVGNMASGRAGITNANFGNAPAVPAQGGDGTVLSGACKTIAHYNEDESIHTTADILEYIVEPMQEAFAYWFGFDEGGPPPAFVVPEGGLLIGGEVGLEATGGVALVEPVGGLLIGGEIGLDTTGGDAPVRPEGGLIIGGAVTVSAPLPFPVPIRIPEDHLGCGVYQCLAFTRGLSEIVTMLPFTTVEWNRILDDTSTATLTIDGVANPRALARCCAALSELEPEEHELAIYRNGWRVWSGPMTDLSFPAEQCVIQASDLSWWLSARTIHQNINSVQVDLVNILLAYVQDAMSVDNSAGLVAQVLALAGQLGDRLVQSNDHQLASDVIGELSRTGVDWTTLDRRMLLGPLQPQPAPFPGATPYPTLIDANFRVQPTILVSGSQAGNCFYVNGPPNGAGDLIFGEYGPEFPAQDDHVAQPAAPDYAEIEEQFGRIERVVTESRILDQPGIDFNAQTRYDLLKRPLVYISDGSLLPSSPIPMEKLLPGSLVNVHLSNVCRVIAEPYRIKAVKVQGNSDGSETVDVQWQPLGTGVVLDGSL